MTQPLTSSLALPVWTGLRVRLQSTLISSKRASTGLALTANRPGMQSVFRKPMHTVLRNPKLVSNASPSCSSLGQDSSSTQGNIERHNKQYAGIYRHLLRLAQDSYHRNHCKDVEHRTTISDHAFWQVLLDIVATRKEDNLLNLMLAAYSQEVKDRRGYSKWPGNAFSRLPTATPSHVGTYHLETSTGCTFTGSSFGGFFSAANEPGSDDHPSKAIVPLLTLRRDFDQVILRGFNSLLRPGAGLNEKGRLNLWLLRECSKPGVEYHFRPLGALSSSLFLEAGFAITSRRNLAFVVQLMEVIDTIYSGSFIEKDFGGPGNRVVQDLVLGARPAHMPEPYGKGLNRTLACFAHTGEKQGESETREANFADQIEPCMMVLGF